ncbi:hypothetical protein Y032_1141g3680 [Ancylostoma ceylanicum]|uniref:Uncharacterized protein n=1 Tax=Ancylostoma ceylanicum TaxID=53326 RepID=A0A016W778_9BILA|nr:hypothetical protein Y032_1141g3680 [Ancylostoma ceylanicum]
MESNKGIREVIGWPQWLKAKDITLVTVGFGRNLHEGGLGSNSKTRDEVDYILAEKKSLLWNVEVVPMFNTTTSATTGYFELTSTSEG